MAWLAHQRLGYNYRLSEINAALGVAQCERLDEILDNRRRVAHAYIERLMTNRYLILPTLERRHAHELVRLRRPAQRPVRARRPRRGDAASSAAEGIGCNNYFPPIHLQPYMVEQFGFKPGDFPVLRVRRRPARSRCRSSAG